MLESRGLLGRYLRYGLVHHDEKPIDLFRLLRMTDVLRFLAIITGPHRVYEHPAARIHESEKWKPGGTSETFHEIIPAGGVQIVFLFRLLDIDSRHYEILIDDRFGLGGLDETIEFPAPASPGGVKDDPYGAVSGRGLRSGLVEDLIGRTLLLSVCEDGRRG